MGFVSHVTARIIVGWLARLVGCSAGALLACLCAFGMHGCAEQHTVPAGALLHSVWPLQHLVYYTQYA
jgi:hypothetical protein